jgi:hypothetical protein
MVVNSESKPSASTSSAEPVKPKETFIFNNSKLAVESVNNLFSESSSIQYVIDDQTDPTEIRSMLKLGMQAGHMMNVAEHMSGTIEYAPENGGSLPSSVATIVQPSAKKSYISNGNIEKLVSIAAILYTILMKSIKDDATLYMIADGCNTKGNGPCDNMQPFLMYHNLVDRFGIGDVSSKVDAYDELSVIRQRDLPDMVYIAKFNAIAKRQIQLGQPIPDDLLLFYLLKNSSFQDFYDFIDDFIKHDIDKTWSAFMKKQLKRDKESIANVARRKREDHEGTQVYGITSSHRTSSRQLPTIITPVNSIRSDNYVQIGQLPKASDCTNCFSTTHKIDVCIRPCTKCANRNPSKPLHAAKDCPQIRSQPAVVLVASFVFNIIKLQMNNICLFYG